MRTTPRSHFPSAARTSGPRIPLPEMGGVRDVRDTKGEYTALCTSQPAVRRWMGDALAYVFRQVPDLAGVYSITASENLTSCASLGGWRSCFRCKERSDTDIIAAADSSGGAVIRIGQPAPTPQGTT